MTHWVEDDQFWADTASVIFNPERMKAAATEIEQLVALIKPPPAADVLDLCCGQGRHSLAFAKLGHSVTGVDRNTAYLDAARKAAAQNKVNIDYIQSDMREFRRDGAFDVVANLLTSFGYFENEDDNRLVLANVFASLRSGGRLVIDIMSKEVLARIFTARDWHEESDGAILLQERKIRDSWKWMDARWIILRGKTRTEHNFSLRVYSAAELEEMLRAAGFEEVRAYGALDGRPYDEKAERLVITAAKP